MLIGDFCSISNKFLLLVNIIKENRISMRSNQRKEQKKAHSGCGQGMKVKKEGIIYC